MIRVTVWNEYKHEREYEGVRKVYPQGIHGCIASFLGKQEDFQVRTATFDMPEHGLTEEVLTDTDVLIFGAMPCRMPFRMKWQKGCRSTCSREWD